ncbi:phosphate ABC transporter ATP-binding protein [Marinisporobacter balticus]|uniref:Phosphate ABC transporter ATP-binding protein (PhoT family) n=1 Tax=Marinisporobacter balticus TaxID=2018667 RepID=A0A4R2KHP9_9FIRM|nr:phosphate ABC transporter ATP-binding protein [Marinisporobacter balticus]TCO72684.1 phosphate ABC transporter ATP-binding protein (PhoT family) [Marinisporobacter balticus]
MDHIIETKDLSIYFDQKKILDKINIKIKENKITAIIGPSGCGKSTFIKSLNKMVHEEKNATIDGEILLHGKNINGMEKEIVREKIGMVFQNPMPFPLSIYDNMIYAPIYYGIKDKEKLGNIVKQKLIIAGLYDEVKNNMKMQATKLSGGQQQRLCIARALTVEPEILLLDEPCSALDVKNTANIEEMLKKLSHQYTIVIVTHNLAQAKRIAQYTAFILNGEIIEYDETKKLFENPQDERTKQYIEGIFG